MRGRAEGFTLLEALAVLTLTALLATVLVTTAVAQMRLARAIALRSSARDAARTATWVLSGEARRAQPSDVRAHASDSVALRAFRGRGLVCGATGTTLVVRYTGDRAPNPAKDSLILIAADGESVAALLDVRDPAVGCAAHPGEQLLRLQLDRPAATPLVALLFESGTYHLSGRALRYRTGEEGRQPLTAEMLGGAATRFIGVDSAAIRFRLAPDSLQRAAAAAFFAPPAAGPR